MTEPAPEPKSQNPFTRPGFILAASLILAIISAAVLIALWPRDTTAPQPTPPPAAAAPTTPTADSKGTDSVCGLPSNEEMALSKAPESDWELLDGMAVPTAPETAGPGREAEELRTCFARTPTGALFAASNVLGALTSDTDPVEVIESLVADNDLRDEALAAAAESTPAPVAPEMQIAGFALERYTGTNATVELGIELENGAVGSITLPMVWESGDWKLLLEQSGPPAPVQRTDLSGLIPWNGV